MVRAVALRAGPRPRRAVVDAVPRRRRRLHRGRADRARPHPVDPSTSTPCSPRRWRRRARSTWSTATTAPGGASDSSALAGAPILTAADRARARPAGRGQRLGRARQREAAVRRRPRARAGPRRLDRSAAGADVRRGALTDRRVGQRQPLPQTGGEAGDGRRVERLAHRVGQPAALDRREPEPELDVRAAVVLVPVSTIAQEPSVRPRRVVCTSACGGLEDRDLERRVAAAPVGDHVTDAHLRDESGVEAAQRRGASGGTNRSTRAREVPPGPLLAELEEPRPDRLGRGRRGRRRGP